MFNILIRGIDDLSSPHDISITNIGINAEKIDLSCWDHSSGCSYEVIVLDSSSSSD